MVVSCSDDRLDSCTHTAIDAVVGSGGEEQRRFGGGGTLSTYVGKLAWIKSCAPSIAPTQLGPRVQNWHTSTSRQRSPLFAYCSPGNERHESSTRRNCWDKSSIRWNVMLLTLAEHTAYTFQPPHRVPHDQQYLDSSPSSIAQRPQDALVLLSGARTIWLSGWAWVVTKLVGFDQVLVPSGRLCKFPAL